MLIVDDDRAVRRSLKNLLVTADIDVHLAAHGAGALKLLDLQRVDAAVIDLMMPRLDGLGVARAMLARPAERCPRIVFIVGAQPDVRRCLGRLPVSRVFPAPLDTVEIARELARALRA